MKRYVGGCLGYIVLAFFGVLALVLFSLLLGSVMHK